MERGIPEYLYGLLDKQYGEETAGEILNGYRKRRPTTLRVNRLKTDREAVEAVLSGTGIAYRRAEWMEDALILETARESEIRKLPMYENGWIYLQSLSSMLPPVILSPKEGESILDMAAAPGGKTTQMAAMTGGKAQITACERDKIRADRLRYNLEKQGAFGVYVMVEDARRLDSFFSFDRILLDAPCSGSGTIFLEEGKPPVRFTKDFLNKCTKSQGQLLKKALEVLKPGREMVYSTCSVLEAENEAAVKKALSSGMAELVPLHSEDFPGIPFLPTAMNGVLCVKPDGLYEGFFAAKLRKKR